MKRILHIASFQGNTGDQLSHRGLYNILSRFEVEIEKLEIRDYYISAEDRKFFNEHFVQQANKYDLIIFGGGGFFDFWVEESQTGTTFDISKRELDKISVPFLFLSLGAKPHKKTTDVSRKRFVNFLLYLEKRSDWTYITRNDGTYNELLNLIGRPLKNVIAGLDNAFYFKREHQIKNFDKRKYITINVSHDQLEMHSQRVVDFDIESYYRNLANWLEQNARQYILKFILHIPEDVIGVHNVIRHLSSNTRKTSIEIVGYSSEANHLDEIISTYQNAEFSICARLHSNILAILTSGNVVKYSALSRVDSVFETFRVQPKKEFDLICFDSIEVSKVVDSNRLELERVLSTYLA